MSHITGQRKSDGPKAEAFAGAKALCALAAQVGHIDAQRAQELATSTRPHVDVDLLRTALQNPRLTRQEREYHIHLHYQSLEKDFTLHSGASGIMAYLQRQGRSLSEVTTSDLQGWALTPMGKGKGKFPHTPAFEGAKALCALAAEVGYIDVQRAQELAQCPRPQGDLDSLRLLLQNPALTPKERENHIRLNFQSSTKNDHVLAGAKAFLAHLERAEIPLAEVTKNNLEEWALTPYIRPQGKWVVPNPRAFKGAKALCALAAEVGYIDGQNAQEIAACPRPHFVVDFLRIMLENPTLTGHDSESHICLNYQSRETNVHRQGGANGFLAYLRQQGSSLAEVTKGHLEQWALTQIAAGHGKGTIPSKQSFDGAQALCALAAEVGYIDAHRASEIADCPRPLPSATSTNTATCSDPVMCSEAGLQTAQNSSAMLERVQKRLRTDDQGASTSMSQSFALPQSDALFRELALSASSLLDSQARSPETGGTLTLIEELENLEDILGSAGHFY